VPRRKIKTLRNKHVETELNTDNVDDNDNVNDGMLKNDKEKRARVEKQNIKLKLELIGLKAPIMSQQQQMLVNIIILEFSKLE